MAISMSMSSSSIIPHNKQHITRLQAAGTATAVAVPINLGNQNLATSTSAPSSVSIRHVTTKVPVRSRSKSVLANMWREIQGESNWANLIEPLHPVMLAEIIRYGELVTSCYKAFDLDPRSKRYLNCKYGKSRMMEETGLGNSGYTVTKYIYATPDIDMPTCCSRWIGYVAVATDEKEIRHLGRRDIIVSFRGTVTSAEWVANFMSSLSPARFDPHNDRPDVMVETGFLSLYTSDDRSSKFTTGSCRNQLLSEISRLINQYKDEEISITLAGHSMGSSLATLLGYDLAELGLNRDAYGRKIPITVYSFAGPRVGNLGFKERCEALGVKVLRVVNVNDPVTKLPGMFLNENFRSLGERFEFPWSCSCYTHVGVELALNFFKMNNPACVHDLDAYIGLLKCPAQMADQMKREGEDVFTRVKDFVSKQSLDNAWRFEAAAFQIGNLVQSLNI
jgi:Lipase (class 3)